MIDSQNSGIMGTEIEGKGYGYYSMRDVNNNNNNEQSSGNNWPILYGEKSLPSSNREYGGNGFSHRSTASVSVVEFDKNTLRQTMLEHEAIFKRHVAQLHCLYKVQRDMMDEVRRKDFHKHPLDQPPPPPSSTPFSAWNSSQDCEILDHRPSKVRKRLFDLQFTADQEGECSYDGLDCPSKRGADASKGFVFLADLNEPITQAEETESISWMIEAKSKSEFLHRLSKENSRRDQEDAAAAAALRSNGKGDWSYAEHYKNHHLNSSSSQDAIQTLGFLQSEQRRELHGRKHSPFGVINNHKTDWSQSWGKSIQNPPNPPLQTNSSLYSSKPLSTSNLCFSRPSANNHHNNGWFYRGSSSGSKDASACFPPVVGLDHLNPIDKGRKHNHHPHFPSWLIPDDTEFKPKNPNPAKTTSTPPPPSRKILGFTITDDPPTSASLPPTTPIREDVKKEGIINSRELIDINVAYYDPEPELEPEPEENKKKTRTHIIIDLNSCITELEEDIPAMEPMKRNLLGPKFSMQIDLEAPPQPEEEDEEEEDNAKIAAETILSISVSADEENSMEDPLGWFAEIVVRPPNNNNNNNSLSLCEEIMDYFEAITLSLPEMKQEEYIPKEVINPKEDEEEEEELGGMIVQKKENRIRRSRRGRQKRDFQRDILPGLVSLSRHEVSEDIQTFSGLMKATGHTWQSGLTRGRRRRVVVELCSTPAVVVEEVTAQSLLEVGGSGSSSSLTTAAWGKTLRRPRRQRCPPATPNPHPNPNPNPTTTTAASNCIISS